MIRTTTLISLLLILTASSALALDIPMGPRVGYTNWNSLNQIHLGAHARLGELFPNVEMTPSVELGFGGDLTVLTINGDLVYKFTELAQDPWGFYGGGSLSLNYLDSDLDLGLSALLGTTYNLSNGNTVLGEIRLGILDSPDFKLTFGYTLF